MTKYLVWSPYYGESEKDALTIETFYASSAAEKWTEKSDSDSQEYSIANGTQEITVLVKDKDGLITSFTVWGEYDPVYYSRENK